MAMSTAAQPQCPHCHKSIASAEHAFCTSCGMALRQPCPQCAHSIVTPPSNFTSCHDCHTSFWSCPECGRLYHLDRTSCQNSYCPEKGKFWTARFGSDSWDHSLSYTDVVYARPKAADLLPGWLASSTGSEKRLPNLHHCGLLVSVLESGVIELWAEHGSPSLEGRADEFREQSVCLARLDLGEPASGAPVVHQNQPVILGSDSLSILEWSSNPSLGARIELPLTAGPLQAVPLEEALLVLSPEGLWEIDINSGSTIVTTKRKLTATARARLDPKSRLVLVAEADNSLFMYHKGGQIAELPRLEAFSKVPEWALFAGHFTFISGNKLAYLEDGSFKVQELPAGVIAGPVYDELENRLILAMSDNTIRTCSPRGDRFSFLCELAGAPTTTLLKVGQDIYYGIEGKYLCSNQEALLPRLNSPPWGELSYANSRIFGNTRDGGLFCFLL